MCEGEGEGAGEDGTTSGEGFAQWRGEGGGEEGGGDVGRGGEGEDAEGDKLRRGDVRLEEERTRREERFEDVEGGLVVCVVGHSSWCVAEIIGASGSERTHTWRSHS